MKLRSFHWVVTCAVLFLSGIAARGADEPVKVVGNWEMTTETRQGSVTWTLKVEQEGEKIKGTLKGPRGESSFTGSVKGNTIRFSVKRETPRGDFTIEYT